MTTGSAIRRRRQCPECGRRFSTTETASLSVIKRSGVIEPFSREKVVLGVRRRARAARSPTPTSPCSRRRSRRRSAQTGASQIDANDIGLAILPPLRELDEVAYLRFASVYQAFESLDDFEAAIGQLRAEHGRLPARPVE